MATFIRCAALLSILLGLSGTASAQATAGAPDQSREADRIRLRQKIATMEAILATAITNGAEMVMAQVRMVMPTDRPRLMSAPHVSGVRLDGYGMLFHVQVPDMQLPILWEVRQIVQSQDAQTRQIAMQLQQMRTELSRMPPGPNRESLERYIFKLEQSLDAGSVRVAEGSGRPLRAASLNPEIGAAAGAGGGRAGGGGGAGSRQQAADPRVLEDPQDAYTREVKAALIDAMLQNNQAFALSADEWLTIVANDSVPTNPLQPGDSVDDSTWVMRVKGSVLASYRAGSITIEDARKQVEVTEQ